MSVLNTKKYNRLTMDSKTDGIPLCKYPRPQFVRDSFICLNGEWDGGVTVPFPLESEKSGYEGKVKNTYTYSRTFSVPQDFIKDRVLLHFGAVDEIAEVFVDGESVGVHFGGYLPFSFDITEYVKEKAEAEHILKVVVTDALSHVLPYGKQKKNRGGMWYTPVTGIWQSVWLESVPERYIEAVEITPSLDKVKLDIFSESTHFFVKVTFKDEVISEGEYAEKYLDIPIRNPKLWTPDEPNLYNLEIKTDNDEVHTYFALRTVSVDKVDGVPRILLNGKPFFFHGVLDQGYFPEGIFTPNRESDYEEDILRLKKLGINTIRKHIKIEPACFYEACDRLGMIVFQDMVNNGKYSFIRDTAFPTIGLLKRDDTKKRVKEEVKAVFEQHMEKTLTYLYNFPCIVYYTIFNEGWGQFDSDEMYSIVKSMDQSRIIDSTSGWFWQQKSDVDSYHVYFKPLSPVKSERPIIVSEFGGYSYKDAGHSFNRTKNYGYGKAKNIRELTDMILSLYRNEVIPAIPMGLCGTIYTQGFDVEDETNGLYTYDRKICKVVAEDMIELSKELKIHS